MSELHSNHKVIIHHNKKIWVCCGHMCDIDGVEA